MKLYLDESYVNEMRSNRRYDMILEYANIKTDISISDIDVSSYIKNGYIEIICGVDHSTKNIEDIYATFDYDSDTYILHKMPITNTLCRFYYKFQDNTIGNVSVVATTINVKYK